MTHFVDRLLMCQQIHIGFTRLRIRCFIGTLPQEQSAKQEILLSLKIALPALKAASSDEIGTTIDYTALARLCEEMALAHPHQLLETLAREILEEVFMRFSPTYAWIRIEKPAALLAAQCAYVEFEKRSWR
jgi:D-erythro-7,8-dihydroneopterin triphosphate epimerase